MTNVRGVGGRAGGRAVPSSHVQRALRVLYECHLHGQLVHKENTEEAWSPARGKEAPRTPSGWSQPPGLSPAGPRGKVGTGLGSKQTSLWSSWSDPGPQDDRPHEPRGGGLGGSPTPGSTEGKAVPTPPRPAAVMASAHPPPQGPAVRSAPSRTTPLRSAPLPVPPTRVPRSIARLGEQRWVRAVTLHLGSCLNPEETEAQSL